ncbi:MAG: M28 family peptidase [Solirubrobacterales bacterium]
MTGAEPARLRADVAALAAIERGAGGDGERRSAEWLAARLREAGAAEVRLAPFRYQRTYAWAHAAHLALGMVGGAAAATAAVSYELEFSGRSQWLRRLLPGAPATNVIARLPASGARRRTLVLLAHHDAARTGLIWNPRLVALSRGGSFATLPAAAFALAVPRRTRRLGRALLAGLIALELDVARGRPVPGASDNASGVAAALALVARWAREPLPGCEVLVLFPGCEEAGMGGTAAWLRAEGAALDPATTLVLGLDTLGAGEPVVAAREGGVIPTRYRARDLAWADAGAAAVALPAPERARVPGWTDPALTLFAGLPSISLLSMRDGLFTEYHLPSDVPQRVDWSSVERCLAIAAGAGAAWAAGDSAP